jgi:hypothetical protein
MVKWFLRQISRTHNFHKKDHLKNRWIKKMCKMTNSTNLVKELFSNIDPTRFKEIMKSSQKQESIYLLRSSKI